MNQQDDVSQRSSLRNLTNNYPYTPSIASAASSSASSLFSADGKSSQSSAPSSAKGSSPIYDSDGYNFQSVGNNEYANSQANIYGFSQDPQSIRIQQQNAIHVQQILPSENAVAPELRINPRRTQAPLVQTDDGESKARTRTIPALVRQDNRKDNFVESLVGKLTSPKTPSLPFLTSCSPEDTTTQMIEVIWPLSVIIYCDRDAVLGGKNLIGLRTFIQEVLKRSKTSYSTLQVALYYLVLIKSCLPCGVDFTKVQTEDTHATRAMQCGRRMFLAALILASKYLQDRNYSARAWSKISGLKVSEINANERAFLAAIDWKLHVPEERFQRWTDVVLKFSLSHTSSSLRCRETSPNSWRSVIPRLTPELDDLCMGDLSKPINVPVPDLSRGSFFSSPMCPPPARRIEEASFGGEATPTPALTKPEALEPTPRASRESFRFPPISPRIPQLPTPVMTPQANGFITPAVSVGSYCRGQSMSDAMKQIQRSSIDRCTLDTWPYPPPTSEAFSRRIPLPSRRPSYAFSSSSTISTISSPESMISDCSSQSSWSSRTSRSSSVCSVASSTGALPQPSRLAVQATRRCATMAAVKEQDPCDFVAEPTCFAGVARESYVRGLDCQENSENAAALALSNLSCGQSFQHPNVSTALQRKRERSCSSKDSSSFDAEVRALLPSTLETCRMVDDITVAEDNRPATSFLLRDDTRRLPFERISNHIRSASGSREGVRKRTCMDDAWPNAEVTMSPICV
ncbi:hypothetical protein MMC10_010400 [Thelotrema lepadinum]|nr:hypothetical protein [Thelotrema lepadinum]